MSTPIKVSQLPAADPLDGSEIAVVVQAGQSKQVPVGELAPPTELCYFQEGAVAPFTAGNAWRRKAPTRPLSIKAWTEEPATAQVSLMVTVDGVDYMPSPLLVDIASSSSTEVDLSSLPVWPADAAIRVKMTAGACTGLAVRITYR